MSTFLIVLHVFTCILLVLVVLVQAGKDGGIGMMTGGSSQTVFGSSGGANFFTKFTTATAAIFMVTSIALTLVRSGHKRSVFENVKPSSSATTAPTASEPSTDPTNPTDSAATDSKADTKAKK